MDQQQPATGFGRHIRHWNIAFDFECCAEKLNWINGPALPGVLRQVQLPKPFSRKTTPRGDGYHVRITGKLAFDAQPHVTFPRTDRDWREVVHAGFGFNLKVHMRGAFVNGQLPGVARRDAHIHAEGVHRAVAGQITHHHDGYFL